MIIIVVVVVVSNLSDDFRKVIVHFIIEELMFVL